MFSNSDPLWCSPRVHTDNICHQSDNQSQRYRGPGHEHRGAHWSISSGNNHPEEIKIIYWSNYSINLLIPVSPSPILGRTVIVAALQQTCTLNTNIRTLLREYHPPPGHQSHSHPPLHYTGVSTLCRSNCKEIQKIFQLLSRKLLKEKLRYSWSPLAAPAVHLEALRGGVGDHHRDEGLANIRVLQEAQLHYIRNSQTCHQ